MQRLINAPDGLLSLEKLLEQNTKITNVLLVTGKASFEATGAKSALNYLFETYNVTHFSDFEVNPKLADVEKGLRLLKGNLPDVIIAIGGGSVIDMAKLLKANYATGIARLEGVISGMEDAAPIDIPLIAIPTTAGSGSEATHFAVCYIGTKKFSVACDDLLPNIVILDGHLLASSKSNLRACNALDALSQAIEGAWAVGGTKASRAFAFQAIRIILKNINAFVKGSNDADLNQDMITASYIAGKAINISKTTAAHAWSYGFTSKYGVPHGSAVWLTMPRIFALHAKHAASQTNSNAQFVETMKELLSIFEFSKIETIEAELNGFLQKIGAPDFNQIMSAHTTEERLEIAGMVNMQRLKNNPVQFSSEEINHIFGTYLAHI